MSLPEQLRMEDMSANFSAQMSTQKVQPVSSSTETTRWELPKTGIMGNGYIEFQWQPGSDVTAGSNGGTLSSSVGAAGCIDRIMLSSQSGTIVYDGRFWNNKQAVEKSWRDGAFNHFVAPYKDGSWFSHRMADNVTEPAADQGRLRMSGIPFAQDGTPSPAGSNWSVPDVVKIGGVRSPGVAGALQQFQINLADLMPFLYNVMIPTISTETLYLDIFWTQDDLNGSVYCPSTGQAYANAGSVVQGSNMFLMVDTMLYDDPAIMDSIFAHQEANGGLLTMPYVDYNTQIISNNRAALPATFLEELDRSLGCNDYQLVSIKNMELAGLGAGDALSNNSILGKYWSNGQQRRHLQFVLNDANLYPDNQATQSQNFNRLAEVYDHVVPYIPRSVYATQITPGASGIVPTTTFMGFTQQAVLSGAYNMCGIQLRDDAGQPFQNGNQPVRLFYAKTSSVAMGTFDESSIQYYFIEYLRAFTISKTGKVQVNERLMTM